MKGSFDADFFWPLFCFVFMILCHAGVLCFFLTFLSFLLGNFFLLCLSSKCVIISFRLESCHGIPLTDHFIEFDIAKKLTQLSQVFSPSAVQSAQSKRWEGGGKRAPTRLCVNFSTPTGFFNGVCAC